MPPLRSGTNLLMRLLGIVPVDRDDRGPLPRTGNDVLELVRKSGLADDATLKAFLKNAGPLPTAPGEAAAQFLLAGIITELQAEFILQGQPKGFHLGKYVLISRMGNLGTGEWFLSHHRMMRRQVTLHVWPAGLDQDTPTMERIYRDGRIGAALEHPHIVRTYDLDQWERTHFSVLEALDGKSLTEVLKIAGGRLPVGEACGCAIQVAAGLQYVHEKKVCHHDINPSNLFVCENGIVKILNLGFAWIRFLGQGETDPVNDLDYFAPEQVLDSPPVLDHRADIFSLGAILDHLVTGRAPFAHETDAGKKMIALFMYPVPLAHTVCADVPESLSHIIAKMMAKRVEERYQSMTEVLAALRPFVARAPTGEYPEMAAAALETQ